MSTSAGQQTIRTPRLAVNYVILSGGEFLAKMLGLVSFAYLARMLGPQTYGYLEFAIAITFFLTLLVDSGLSTYGAREVARDKASMARYAAHIIPIKLLLSLVSLAILAILVRVLDRPWAVKQLILLYGVTLLVWPGLLPWVFQGLDQMQFVALASIIRWMLFAAGVFLLVRQPEQAWVVPLIEGGALAGVAAFYLWRLSRLGGLGRQRPNLALAWSIFRQAWFIGASEMVWAVKVYAATVLLGLLVGGAQVGWFAAAHRVVVSLHTFVWLYFFNLLPSLARCTQRPLDALLRMTGTSMQVTAWLAVFLGLVGTALAQPLIVMVYGEPYRQTASVLQVLVWLIPLTLLHGHYRYVLIAYGKQSLEFLSEVCAAGLNVFLVLLLVPSYGPIGAAWFLVASELFTFGLVYHLTRRTVARIPFWPHLLRPLMAGAILGVVLVLLRSVNVWVLGIAAVVVYSITLVIMQPSLVADVRSLFSSGL